MTLSESLPGALNLSAVDCSLYFNRFSTQVKIPLIHSVARLNVLADFCKQKQRSGRFRLCFPLRVAFSVVVVVVVVVAVTFGLLSAAEERRDD